MHSIENKVREGSWLSGKVHVLFAEGLRFKFGASPVRGSQAAELEKTLFFRRGWRTAASLYSSAESNGSVVSLGIRQLHMLRIDRQPLY